MRSIVAGATGLQHSGCALLATVAESRQTAHSGRTSATGMAARCARRTFGPSRLLAMAGGCGGCEDCDLRLANTKQSYSAATHERCSTLAQQNDQSDIIKRSLRCTLCVAATPRISLICRDRRSPRPALPAPLATPSSVAFPPLSHRPPSAVAPLPTPRPRTRTPATHSAQR